MECLQKMRQQLEQLFQFSRVSDTATDMQIEAAIQPVDVFGQSSQSISPDDDKPPSEDLPLPVFLPLEIPKFDFDNVKFDDWAYSLCYLIATK